MSAPGVSQLVHVLQVVEAHLGGAVAHRGISPPGPWPAAPPLSCASVLASSPPLFRPQHLKWEDRQTCLPLP